MGAEAVGAKLRRLWGERGLGGIVRAGAGRAASAVFESNSAVWLLRDMHQAVLPPQPRIELTYTNSYPEAVEWVESLGLRWMAYPEEVALAKSNGRVSINSWHEGRLIGIQKAAWQQVYIPDFWRPITFPPDTAFLYDVYVLPEYRSQGVGGALIRQTLLTLQQMGFRRVLTHIPPWNEPSLKAIGRVGFVRLGLIRNFRVLGIKLSTGDPVKLAARHMRGRVRVKVSRKILYIADSFTEMCGAEKNLYLVATGIKARGFEPIVYCLRAGLESDLEEKGIPLVNLKLKKLSNARGLAALLGLLRLIRRERVELIVTYYEGSDMLGLLLSRLTGIPVISNRRDMGYRLKPKHVRMYRATNRSFSRIITCSEAVKSAILETQGGLSRRIVPIHNGTTLTCEPAALPLPREALGLDSSHLVIGMVASLRRIKGHEFLIKAAPQVVARYPEARFVIIGHDNAERGYSSRDLLSLAEELGVRQNVIYLGKRTDVPRLLPLFDVSVLPSLSEGFSNTLIESMAVGKPVVATAVGGTPEAVVDGKTGLLVPPGDPAALAEAICRLLADPELRRRMGEEAQERVRSYFRPEQMIDGHVHLYEEVIEEHHAPRRWRWRKALKLGVSRALYYSGALDGVDYLLKRSPAGRGLKILAYHRVSDSEPAATNMAVSLSNFRDQIRFLKRRFQVADLGEAAEALRNGGPAPDALAITFDDGYRDNFSHAFPVMKEHGVPATVFATAGCMERRDNLWVDKLLAGLNGGPIATGEAEGTTWCGHTARAVQVIENLKRHPEERYRMLSLLPADSQDKCSLLSWEEVARMAEGGISFGSHSLYHPILTELCPEDARKEILQSKQLIEERLGRKIRLFAYPNGMRQDFNQAIIDMLKEYGYTAACTLMPGLNRAGCDPYALRRIYIQEDKVTDLRGNFSPALFAFETSTLVCLLRGWRTDAAGAKDKVSRVMGALF